MTDSLLKSGHRDVWHRLFTGSIGQDRSPDITLSPNDTGLTDRMSGLLGAGLAASVAAGLFQTASGRQVVQESRLYNRLNRTRQQDLCQRLTTSGFEFAVIKGLASAWTLYEDPDVRIGGDLDILVRDRQVARDIAAFLQEDGYRFETDFPLPVWGFPSDASFLPLVSSDKLVHLDLHIAPDSYPLHFGLSVDDVLDNSLLIDSAGFPLMAPRPEHAFLISMSNAVRERFGPTTVRSFVDAGRLVLRGLDGGEVLRRAGKAGIKPGLLQFVAILSALDPENRDLREFAGQLNAPKLLETHPAVQPLAEFRTSEPGPLVKLTSELCHSYTWWRLAGLWVGRIRGVFYPRSGLP